MKLEEIKSIFKNLEQAPIGVKNKYSVLIPLIEVEGELHLLYEVRSGNLKTQPGEISFPGGRIEEGENPLEAAVRETMEELLIEENDIEIIKESDFLVNPYSSILYSAVGIIKKNLKDIKPSEDEVDSIFTVPLDFFIKTKPRKYELELKVEKAKLFPYELIPNGENYKFRRGRDEVLFYEYEGKIIWGFTAKLTNNFICKLNVI